MNNDMKSLLEAVQFTNKADTVDIAKLKFVLYARKSTTSDERQERSISDQISDCIDLSKRIGLNVVKVYRESESAKDPDIRPLFKEMVSGIKLGKYSGVLTWHPDRLARNMKDAGEIIDLLDKKILKSLQFTTFAFENSPMGKMLLGISFVLSKQYSDHLSESVSRGIRKSIEEGKYLNIPKHGYYKDPNGFLRPDGNNYILIKNAFLMRLEGKTLEDIVKYLNESGYTRAPAKNKQREKTYTMTINKVSLFLRDPFYTGLLVHGKYSAILSDLYDFTEMITVDEFKKINENLTLGWSFKLAKSEHRRGKIKADLLRGLVVCGYCNNPFTAGITTKLRPEGKKMRFYYRCETHKCEFRNKSIRAKVVLDFVYDFLENHNFAIKQNYLHYLEETKKISRVKQRELVSTLGSLQQTKIEAEKRLIRTKDLILEQEKEMRNLFENDAKDLIKKIEDLNQRIKNTKTDITKNSEAVMTYQKFLELYGNLAKITRETEDMEMKDKIIRKIFSNFVIKDKKVAEYRLNLPFSDFFDQGRFLSCRDSGT